MYRKDKTQAVHNMHVQNAISSSEDEGMLTFFDPHCLRSSTKNGLVRPNWATDRGSESRLGQVQDIPGLFASRTGGSKLGNSEAVTVEKLSECYKIRAFFRKLCENRRYSKLCRRELSRAYIFYTVNFTQK